MLIAAVWELLTSVVHEYKLTTEQPIGIALDVYCLLFIFVFLVLPCFTSHLLKDLLHHGLSIPTVLR